jgi:hypothetical protein
VIIDHLFSNMLVKNDLTNKFNRFFLSSGNIYYPLLSSSFFKVPLAMMAVDKAAVVVLADNKFHFFVYFFFLFISICLSLFFLSMQINLELLRHCVHGQLTNIIFVHQCQSISNGLICSMNFSEREEENQSFISYAWERKNDILLFFFSINTKLIAHVSISFFFMTA